MKPATESAGTATRTIAPGSERPARPDAGHTVSQRRLVAVGPDQTGHVAPGDLGVLERKSIGRRTLKRLVDELQAAGAAGLILNDDVLSDVPLAERAVLSERLPLLVLGPDWTSMSLLEPAAPDGLRSDVGLRALLRGDGGLEGLSLPMDEARPVKGLAVVAHAEGQATLPLSKLEELVAGEVIPGDPRAQVLALDGAVVALIGEYGAGEESGALGRAILHRARSALFLSGVRIGIGRPHAGRQGLRRTYREALWAAAVAERLWDGDRVVTFRDLGIYGLLEPLLADPATADTEDVERLIQYDRKNHTALLPTLEMFFDVCSPGETASKLFVHRNTVTYRLRAVKRVTGLDVVSNPDARLHLEVQMRIARLRGILPATKPRPRRVRGRR